MIRVFFGFGTAHPFREYSHYQYNENILICQVLCFFSGNNYTCPALFPPCTLTGCYSTIFFMNEASTSRALSLFPPSGITRSA